MTLSEWVETRAAALAAHEATIEEGRQRIASLDADAPRVVLTDDGVPAINVCVRVPAPFHEVRGRLLLEMTNSLLTYRQLAGLAWFLQSMGVEPEEPRP